MTQPVHRPYSKLRNQEVSVTSALPTPAGLDFAAARETALFATLHRDRWLDLPEAEAIELLRKHFRGVWDSRACLGTVVHAVNDLYCAGHEVDIEALIESAITTDRNARLWQDMSRDDLIEMVLGYVLGLEKWWEDFAPSVTHSEAVVRWPGKYIGSTDLRALIHGRDRICDLKNTAHQSEDKGLYFDDWCKQINGYAWAKEEVHYELVDGKVAEVGTSPWTLPEVGGIIHLRGNEQYDFYEVPISEENRDRFLAHVDDHYWKKTLGKPQLIRPVGAAA